MRIQRGTVQNSSAIKLNTLATMFSRVIVEQGGGCGANFLIADDTC
jgi:hypothetical protein